MCSEEDSRRWTDAHGPHTSVRIVPNTVRTDWMPGLEVVARRYPHRMLLTGVFSYRPNIEAARELAELVLPAVRAQVPDASVELVGRHPTARVRALHDPERGVQVRGEVDDIRPHLLGAGVMVVPLRVGGGTRLKILEAMSAGLPVVATATAAEGLCAVDGTHLLIAESPQEIATAALTLMSDGCLATRLARAARELVEARFSRPALRSRIASSVRDLELV